MNEPRLDLSFLRHTTARVADDRTFSEQEHAEATLEFSDGTRLAMAYWRVIVDGHRHRDCFDHKQQYGLPAPINAKEELRSLLENRKCTNARLDGETGDLHFEFEGEIKLQVFNFTCYEIWTLYFSDGRVQYSNYV